MQTARLSELELIEGWSETDATRRVRFLFPVHRGTGACQSAVVYFELEPGDHAGMHADSAEEVLLVWAGRVEGTVGGKRGVLEAGDLVVIPAHVPHDVANVGDETARLVGLFTSNVVTSIFDDPFAPFGLRVVGSPTPTEDEVALSLAGR